MKFIKTLAALALFAHAAAALADPPAQVGRLSFIQGTVSFAPADAGSDWMAAQLNWPVTTGDRLWADRDGRAEIRIGATAIRVNALTSVDILRLDDQATQLRLPQGTVNIRLRQLDPGDSFEVSTPGGAILLTRPGSYRVHVDPAGATTAVLVRQGQADVLTGGNPAFSLSNGQFVTLSSAGHNFYSAPAPDEFENWAIARDRQEERVVATRYVAPAMTGYEDLDQHGAWHHEPEYGNVWVPAVAALPVGWAPYRYGRWVWVSPWGWTWVDNAPWGFAPYHYGRWVWLGHRWAWAPGVRVARPVYAPALVAFVGGRNWSVSVSSGPAVGWVPLGWREPYIPWYRHSPTYVRNVNVTHVTNVTVINQYSNVNNVTRIRYVNRDVPAATTVVTRDTFLRARPVHQARLDVPAQALAAAHVAHAAPVLPPGRRPSLAAELPGARLPQTVAAREVVAARAPAAPALIVQDGVPGKGRDARDERRADNERKAKDERRAPNERGVQDDRPRVRVLNAQAMQRPAAASRGAPETTPQLAAPAGVVPMAPGDTRAPADRRERAADKAQFRADTKAGEAPRSPGPRERAAEHAQGVPDSKTPPDVRERPADRARIAPDSKAPHEAPRPPTTTLTPDDAQRLQQQERQAREAQQRQARAQQEKQLQDQKEQQQRALAAQQQQERQAQQAREEQQRQMRAQQQRQSQEQQEQQRLQQQQQQQRLLQQQQAAQERQAQQAREEQQRQARAAQQREQHQQAQQQRAQAEQQRRAEHQQRRDEREAKRRPPENPEQAPPQARARAKPEPERAPQGR